MHYQYLEGYTRRVNRYSPEVTGQKSTSIDVTKGQKSTAQRAAEAGLTDSELLRELARASGPDVSDDDVIRILSRPATATNARKHYNDIILNEKLASEWASELLKNEEFFPEGAPLGTSEQELQHLRALPHLVGKPTLSSRLNKLIVLLRVAQSSKMTTLRPTGGETDRSTDSSKSSSSTPSLP